MLLSPMEIAEICQEQNAVYCRAIGQPQEANAWSELSPSERLACEKVVNIVLRDPKFTPLNPKNNVEKIMGELMVGMVRVLEKL